MMKNSKLKFSEYVQNISRFKSFGKFVLIVISKAKHVLSKYLAILIAPHKFLALPTALQTVVDHRFRVRSDFTPSSAVCIAYAHFLGLSVTKQRVL